MAIWATPGLTNGLWIGVDPVATPLRCSFGRFTAIFQPVRRSMKAAKAAADEGPAEGRSNSITIRPSGSSRVAMKSSGTPLFAAQVKALGEIRSGWSGSRTL
jgi:hypothetical protein